MSDNKIINELEQVEPIEPNADEATIEQVKKQFKIRFYEREAFDELCDQFKPTINKAYYLTYALDRRSKEKFMRFSTTLLFKGVSKCRKNARKLRRQERRAERQAKRARRRAERREKLQIMFQLKKGK